MSNSQYWQTESRATSAASGRAFDSKPSHKQVTFLDGLASQLGYPSGKAFARDLFGQDQYGLTKWTKDSVSTCIENALVRVKKLKKIQRARHSGTHYRERIKPETATS